MSTEDDQRPPQPGTVRLVWGEPLCGEAQGRPSCRVYSPDGADDLARNRVRRALKRAGLERCDGCGYWVAKEAETDAVRFEDLMHRLGVLRLTVEHRGRGAPVTRH